MDYLEGWTFERVEFELRLHLALYRDRANLAMARDELHTIGGELKMTTRVATVEGFAARPLVAGRRFVKGWGPGPALVTPFDDTRLEKT